MKRFLCLALVLVFMLALGGQAFADGEVLYCRMCGRKIPTDSRVCPYCGVAVVHADDSAGTAASAAPAAAPAAPAAQTVQNTAQMSPGPFNTTLDYTGAVSSRVRVTKSPTSESVPYGGSCLFVAHAANATSITWYIASADSSIILTAYEAADKVSGLHVSGGNTDTLSLSGIPSWMNGCQVQACFTGEGGPVYTDIAKIWTYEETCRKQNCDFWYSDWCDWHCFDPCYFRTPSLTYIDPAPPSPPFCWIPVSGGWQDPPCSPCGQYPSPVFWQDPPLPPV